MHRHALRGFVAIPALGAAMILAAGCSSSSSSSPPKATPTAKASTSAAAAACHKVQATLGQAPATLSKLALHPSSAQSEVTAFVTKLKQEATSSGNAALTSAVDQFTASVQKALGSAVSKPSSITTLISQLTKDSQKIVAACTNTSG